MIMRNIYVFIPLSHSPPIPAGYWIYNVNLLITKPLLTIIAIYFISFKATAQLTQETWMIGGSGIFSSSKDVFPSRDYMLTTNASDIKISAGAGFFFIKDAHKTQIKGFKCLLVYKFTWEKMKTIKVYKKYFLWNIFSYYYLASHYHVQVSHNLENEHGCWEAVETCIGIKKNTIILRLPIILNM